MKKIKTENVKEINEFIDTVSKDKTIDLSIFYKNLETLNFYRLSSDELNEITGGSGDAAYEYRRNEIYASQKSYKVRSIYHELFHMASTKKEKNIIYNGYLIEDIDNNMYRGRGINEGYTELLCERYFDTATNYDFERILVKQLEQIVGNDILKNNYFNPNLDALINELSKYSSIEETEKFISSFDTYNYYMSLSNEGTKETVQEALDNCCSYIFYTYLNKLKINESNDIDELLLNFINEFTFQAISKDDNNYGWISIGESIKKIGESSGMFNLTLDEEQNNEKTINRN